MRTQDAIEHFKNLSGLADALHLSPSAICQWGDFPPPKRQLQIARLSDLKPEGDVWDQLLGAEGVALLQEKCPCLGDKHKARKGRK